MDELDELDELDDLDKLDDLDELDDLDDWEDLMSRRVRGPLSLLQNVHHERHQSLNESVHIVPPRMRTMEMVYDVDIHP